MSRESDLALARKLSAELQVDEAYVIADRYLKDNPNDVVFLTIMVYIMLSSDKPVIAYHLAKRVSELAPNDPAVWVNMGMACQDLWRSKEAERAYKRGIKLEPDDERRSMLMVNLCALYIDIGKFAEAEPYARESLRIYPDHRKSLANLGFCQLAQRNWKEGWPHYRECIGHDWRPRTQYANEPDWNGERVKKLCLYAEQGLGDVISFASMIPDAEKMVDKIVLECDFRLKGLLQRSFPNVTVYGTREQKKLAWKPEDHKPDASLPMGQVAEYCRNKDSDFPGTPYLKVDPDRAYMWKQLFKKKKKPCIGIFWRGGIPKTGARYRQWDLEQLLPIFKSVDAHWVSLQYKPAGKEIAVFKEAHPDIDIVEYPHATLTNDYDDTAALVSALDQCVGMQSAITHLAGGLGIPCWTHIPMNSQWRYGGDGEDYIWCKSVRLIRQQRRGEWADVIEKTAGELSDAYKPRVRKAAKNTPQKGKLRSNGRKVRRSDKSNSRSGGDRPSA
jgi:hypothetical protein